MHKCHIRIVLNTQYLVGQICHNFRKGQPPYKGQKARSQMFIIRKFYCSCIGAYSYFASCYCPGELIKMESHNFSNVSSGSLECFNFSVQTYHSVLGIKNLFEFGGNSEPLRCLFHRLGQEAERLHVSSGFYLMITDVVQAVAIILISIPVTVPSEEQAAQVRKEKWWHDACIGTGFASVMSLWMGNIIVFWIVI